VAGLNWLCFRPSFLVHFIEPSFRSIKVKNLLHHTSSHQLSRKIKQCGVSWFLKGNKLAYLLIVNVV
jgi:hypothetical protein